MRDLIGSNFNLQSTGHQDKLIPPYIIYYKIILLDQVPPESNGLFLQDLKHFFFSASS